MRFTVLGASGFIGSHLVAELRRRGKEVAGPSREEWEAALSDRPGHVIYSAGVTADFRTRPIDTVRVHAGRLTDVLERGGFDSLLYLSSTRLYGGSESGSENSTFHVDPQAAGDLYNLSKLLGESLCLSRRDARVRVARVANVYGPDWSSDNFIITLARATANQEAVELGTAPGSSKDYVSIADVVSLLIAIAERGKHSIYNVASGVNTSNEEIAAVLRRCGVRVTYLPDAPLVVFPGIDVTRVRSEFAFTPRSVTADLTGLIEEYRRWKSDDSH